MDRVERSNLGGYRGADQVNEFDYDSGVIALPLAKREAGHKLIRLHGGIGKRTVRWSMTREGKPPIIPTMDHTSGDTFLSGTVSPAMPVPSATGKAEYDWHVSGEYVFVQNSPRIVGQSAIPVGQAPYVDQSINEAALSLVTPFFSYYSGPTPFHTFVERVALAVPVTADGDYSWPLLAIPTVFTSDHILQD